jgi:hypothetical protein
LLTGALCGNKLYYNFGLTVAEGLPDDVIAQADADTKVRLSHSGKGVFDPSLVVLQAAFMKEVTRYMRAELKRRGTAIATTPGAAPQKAAAVASTPTTKTSNAGNGDVRKSGHPLVASSLLI